MKASYKVTKSRWGDYMCEFMIDGYADTDVKGTDGTGLKFYFSQEQAESAGKRYLKKMQKNGFEI